MYRRNRAFRPRSFAAAASWVLLQAPAIWNGFPLLQYDTGGYLARWYEGFLVPSRAITYGLILNAGAPFSFWPVVAVQSALTVWVIALMLRTHGLGRNPWLLFGICAALSILTTLPWLTAILLTDIFCGLGVLSLYLIVMRGDALTRGEHIGLIVLVAVSAATHSATTAVLCGLLAVAAAFAPMAVKRIHVSAVGRGFIALVLGAILVFAADYLVAGRAVWTPGGFALSFGRMLQDGIVKKYLDEHCPSPALQLCAYKDQLPDDADVWFWGSDLFDKLGRFAGLGHEMEFIATQSVISYPLLQAETAAVATLRQLIDVHTGEGVLNSIWHTYSIIERYAPQLVPDMRAAHQQRGDISFTAVNWLQYPAGLLAIALLPFIMVFAARREDLRDIGELAGVCTLAILGNAFVCGALSNPHDRYGARIVWLAMLVVLMFVLRLMRNRVGAEPG